MIKLTLVFIVFFFIIWFCTRFLIEFGNSKLFWRILIKVLGLVLLTALSLTGIIVLF